MKRTFCILDCYVDEPACLGVPPFVSPYPRYVYGALCDAGIHPESIEYLTIDQIRQWNFTLPSQYTAVFCIGGAIVPGKYLGFKIGTLSEIQRIVTHNYKQKFIIGGLVAHCLHDAPNCVRVTGDIEQYAYHLALNKDPDPTIYRSYEDLSRWAIAGAAMLPHHPQYPHLICEIETYRGCPRLQHCSFCSEGLFKFVEFRQQQDILNEIDACIQLGISRFRIGRQADIIAYNSQRSEYIHGFPKPNVSAICELFTELKKRRDSHSISMLCIDNANPGTIFYFPRESEEIIECIANTVTPGDTMPLGIESFDPHVIRHNNLKLSKENAIEVVRRINAIGGSLVEGVHKLLPGINLIHGLIGENENTFKINYQALHEIVEQGLLLKRINIRTLLPFPGTTAYQKQKQNTLLDNRYRFYRDKIREEIDHVLIQKLYPIGTIIKNMQVLLIANEYSYAKEIRSYAITAKIPLPLTLYEFYDCIVVGHQERSILCLPLPIAINSLPQRAIEAIPGIGKKIATQIIINRPFTSAQSILPYLESVPQSIVGEIIKGI